MVCLSHLFPFRFTGWSWLHSSGSPSTSAATWSGKADTSCEKGRNPPAGHPYQVEPALGAGRCLKSPTKSPGKAFRGGRWWDVCHALPHPALRDFVHFQAGWSRRCSAEEQSHTFTKTRQGLRHAPGLGDADRLAGGRTGCSSTSRTQTVP